MDNQIPATKQVVSIFDGGTPLRSASFLTSDVATLGRVAGFKLKIIKKSPTAEQLVNGENVPNKMALAEGYGQAWDLWSEEKDRERRMG